MTMKFIEHDPAPSGQFASLEALEALVKRVREGTVRGYMIAMVCEDEAGDKTAILKEATSDLRAVDFLTLSGALTQMQAYITEGLTAGDD